MVSPSKDDRGVEVGGASAREALLGRAGLPAGITMEGATPAEGRLRVSFSLSPFTLPGGAPAPKTRGSLPPLSPLSCGAPPRRAGGGHARRSLASLSRSGRRKSVLSRV